MDELVEALIPGGWGVAIGVGVGIALLAGRGIRPVAKQAMKGYMAATEGVKRATSGAKEGFQDIYAEAKAERESARSGEAAQPSGA
jgi:hypothetical protein